MNITFTAPTPFVKPWTLEDSRIIFGNDIITSEKYSLQGTTQGNGLTGADMPVRFSM